MNIYELVDDKSSWIIPYAELLVNKLSGRGHNIQIVFNQENILSCDVAFFLGCTSIVRKEIMDRSDSSVVVHPSALPQGRGFSPLAWQVLEGKSSITVTLFEATETADEGDVYLTSEIALDGSELNGEIKEKQGYATIDLCMKYIKSYGVQAAYRQKGAGSYYKKRTKKDSQLDPYKTIAEQFDLLRVVDNERYPAFFRYRECDYIIKIEKIVN